MSQVASARLGRAIVVVPEVTTGDNPKRADGRKRARFRSAEGVLAVTIANDLALQAAWQVHVPCEHVTGIDIALTAVSPSIGPARVLTAIPCVIVRMRALATTWPAAECARIMVAVARHLWLPAVAIAIAVVGGATVPAIRGASLPLVVARES
jgi:hypothetical protein